MCKLVLKKLESSYLIATQIATLNNLNKIGLAWSDTAKIPRNIGQKIEFMARSPVF